MSSMWAVLIYAAAIGIPSFVLYRYGSAHWYWHALAILTALTVGLVPPPFALQGIIFDAVCGFIFVVLMIWGMGGLFVHRKVHQGVWQARPR